LVSLEYVRVHGRCTCFGIGLYLVMIDTCIVEACVGDGSDCD